MFYAFEALRGKPVGETAQGIAFQVGMFLVLSLMVFLTWNDITRTSPACSGDNGLIQGKEIFTLIRSWRGDSVTLPNEVNRI